MEKMKTSRNQLDLFKESSPLEKSPFPEDLDQAKVLIRKTSIQAFNKSLSLYGMSPMAPPEIDFNLRGKCAGQASWKIRKHLGKNKSENLKLRYNLQAYLLDPAEMIEDTVYHEVAHLVVALRFGTRRPPHGKEWQDVMRNCFGLEPKRTHRLALTPARQVARSFVYACKCRKHKLTSIRHNKVLSGKTIYSCKSCGSILSFQHRE